MDMSGIQLLRYVFYAIVRYADSGILMLIYYLAPLQNDSIVFYGIIHAVKLYLVYKMKIWLYCKGTGYCMCSQ